MWINSTSYYGSSFTSRDLKGLILLVAINVLANIFTYVGDPGN